MKNILAVLYLSLSVIHIAVAQNTNPTNKLSVKPNIIIVLVDDMSYNTLKLDGGPTFLKTPAIDRIANQGVRFTNSFVTFSLCEPSRATLLTGYLPHRHEIITGGKDIDTSFYTLPEILKAHGYRTGLVGKYQLSTSKKPRPGWDYWFSFAGGIDNLNNNGYFNTDCNLNGVDTFISGHLVDQISKQTTDFLNTTTTGQPFFLLLAHPAPHKPYEPTPYYDTLYQNKIPPYFPTTFKKYTKNYPSYLYPDYQYKKDTSQLIQEFKNYYELTKTIDSSVSNIFSYLIANNKLSNTLIIFTSDNGLMFGEHLLAGKRFAYEESIRVPFYIRYPAWFPITGQVDTTNLITNLDIFKTCLDAAGVVDTFNTGGISVRKQLNLAGYSRTCFMYEYATPPLQSIPNLRCVRSKDYMYIRSYCSDTVNDVEEFFDLRTDPKQQVNVIFKSGYQARIQTYRNKLDSIRLSLNDTVSLSLLPCSLKNVVKLNELQQREMDDEYVYPFQAYFNNVENQIILLSGYNYDDALVELYDLSGNLVTKRKTGRLIQNQLAYIPANNLVSGIYILRVTSGTEQASFKLNIGVGYR